MIISETGMLDLNARVDLHEIEIVALDVVEKLDRSGVAVPDRRQEIDRRLVQSPSRRFGKRRGGRLFNHLLIPPLQRAIALAEMEHAPVAETQDLHFDVASALDVALDIERSVAESFLGLDRGPLEPVGQRARVARDDHATPAAAR